MRIRVELLEQRDQQPGPGDTAIMRPQHPSQSLTAEPGAAPLAGPRKAPTADAVVAPAEDRPADRAGAGHDHPAVAAARRTDAGRIRVGGDQELAERMRIAVRSSTIG